MLNGAVVVVVDLILQLLLLLLVAVLYMVVLAVVQVAPSLEVLCMPLQVVAQIDIVLEVVRLVVV
jgi:hypothetical protein